MTELAPLVGKLSPTCRAALERAAERCLQHGHFAVEIAHLLAELAGDPGADLTVALDRYGIDKPALVTDIGQVLLRLPTGNIGNPGVSAHLATAIESAWLVASIDLGAMRINSVALLRALLEDTRLRDPLVAALPRLAALPRQRLADDMAAIIAAGHEGGGSARQTALAPLQVEALGSNTPALAAFALDMTAQANDGQLDPVIGRNAEIDKVIEILMRRRQNNPILTGDAGVGKTAIIEGLAQRIAAGQVPQALAGVAIQALDLGLLQAGASVQGAFEARLRAVIDEVSGAPAATILFIDEAHMLIGAGGAEGQGDAASLLKPALARGGLRVIAATTWAEYKRYFEKDAALARRFQPVKVDPPSPATTVTILRHLAPRLEAFHGVSITEDALSDATRLSQRYIPDRQLPDKAINVLDTACARVAIAQSCRPAALEAAVVRCADLDAEIARLDLEPLATPGREEELDALDRDRAIAEEARDAIASRWEAESYTFDRIRACEAAIAGRRNDPRRAELKGLYMELAEIQQGAPLVPIAVDSLAIAHVVAAWTGIPVGAIQGNAPATAAELKARLGARIIGQDAAIDTIVRRVQTFQADLGDPTKPTGVFLLCGASGVGKTETALALAELLFGGADALITVNMSEYQEAHSVSGLKGAPPGYVGYGKGGVLTEAVRRRPYSVLLLDEVEKAHPDVLEVFYQVFDRGLLEDSEGVSIDFTNTLILLTSNVGEAILSQAAAPDPAALVAALQPKLLRYFAPAFLARLVVVPYRPLGQPELETIVRLKLAAIQARFAKSRRGDLIYDPAVVAAVADQARAVDGGARSIDAILAQQLLPELAGQLLDQLGTGSPIRGARVGLAANGRLSVRIDR